MLGILCEKPSAARNFAKALGGMEGTFDGQPYRIVAARGHLYEFPSDPDKMVSAELASQYKSWSLKNLPWDERHLQWKRVKTKDAAKVLKDIKEGLKGCEEVIIATDDDPTGEGELLAWEILEGLKVKARWSRMYFVDESVKSIQKAFRERKPIGGMESDSDYTKAFYRTRWDYLSMQFTRIASAYVPGRQILRQGRLKSAMIVIVGDQLKLVNAYQKIPFYQNRFRDENGVLYTDPKEPTFKTKDEVPGGYTESPVVRDSAERKHRVPPRLLDMAGLAAELAGQGISAAQVSSTYQKMYEDQVVSYPRTADKTITFEQFNELLPLVDKIAHVVGVDPQILTHRKPRPSHVKNLGSHGANRPGTNVPASLESLEKYGRGAKQIYRVLARNYLAMLAEDFEYELQKGHLEKYPTFKGKAEVPKALGWKAVFNAEEPGEDENAKGLGTIAEPFVYEGFPPKPVTPTMKWLMKQLEKRDVGTGATRTSTFADVTKRGTKFPLMEEKRGKLSLTKYGEESYMLLPGTCIGDLGITEQVMQDMQGIAEGKVDPEAQLAKVKDMVAHDIEVMQQNAGKNLRYHYTKDGQELSFNRIWGEHVFTDEEAARLAAGETISFKTKKGAVTGQLAEQEYKGKTYWGFKPLEYSDAKGKGSAGSDSSNSSKGTASAGFVDTGKLKITGIYKGKEVSFNPTWGGHTFTEEEAAKLLAGESITFGYTTKRGRTRTATGKLGYKTFRGKKYFGFQADEY